MNTTEFLKQGRNAKVSIGSWISIPSTAIAEIMSGAGFEWLVVDMEHSPMSMDQAGELIRTISLSGTVPLVRLSSNDSTQIKRVMDAGSHGVIVPMVNSREDAEKTVQSMRYPPRGQRGVGLARAQDYGPGFDTYRQWLDKGSVIIVQIEHIKAVENIDAILSLPEIDGFIVGPYDLSASLGAPGQFEHPSVIEALAEIRKRTGDHMGGYHVVQPETVQVDRRVEEGYRFIAYSVDFLFLGEPCRRDFAAIKNSLARSSK